MKGSLFLYSDQVVPENRMLDDRLMSCLNVIKPKIAYLSSAPDPQRLYFFEKQKYYRLIGAELVAYYDEHSFSGKAFQWDWSDYDAVHLSGGNTFYFLDWIKRVGITNSLKRYTDGGGTLIGTSAGSLLFCPTIDTAILCGDTNLVNIRNTQALSLVDFYLWPHFTLDSSEERINDVGLPIGSYVFCVPDGAGVCVIGNDIEIYGDVTSYLAQARC